MVKRDKKQIKLNMNIKPEVAMGRPVNFTYISHTPYEFNLDFGVVMPPNNQIEILFRGVLAPERMKEIQNIINIQIKKYEEKYGEITLVKPTKISNVATPDTSTSYIG